MSVLDSTFAWWSRLRHYGLLLSPVVLIDKYAEPLPYAGYYKASQIRDAYTRFNAKVSDDTRTTSRADILNWVDALLEDYFGHAALGKQASIPENVTVTKQFGSRTEKVRPDRVVFGDSARTSASLLVMVDESEVIGRGRGRTQYARLLELLRGTGNRLGLLTNGRQFRLIYAGIDFESWTEWESERWFDTDEGREELGGLRLLLCPESLAVRPEGMTGLLDAIEESRNKQASLSSVLRENVRQAVELILEDVSNTYRSNNQLLQPLINADSGSPLSESDTQDALYQAAVRVVMRLVVCLFAESRSLLPIADAKYLNSYGVRPLYESLEEAIRYEGSNHSLRNNNSAWPRLMALFRLIQVGSAHGAFPFRSYGGTLFRPGDAKADDPVVRALHVLEYEVRVSDDVVHRTLRKLLRGPLPVMRGRSRTYVEGPVDYTNLRTEFIGLIYEGLLDYKLKRTTEATGPLVFLNIGREPVLPLRTLVDMLRKDMPGLKDLLTKLRKEKITATVSSGDDGGEEEDEGAEEAQDEPAAEGDGAAPLLESAAAPETLSPELEPADDKPNALDAQNAALAWAREAALVAGLVGKQKKKESNSTYKARVETEAKSLIARTIATGEFYLVRAGNTRKGSGTFYTKPQLAVPTAHRTLEPLCYNKNDKGMLMPKSPEEILALKVCDPACGSASFLVAALHYLTEALYTSLCYHRLLEDPATAKRISLPFGKERSGTSQEELPPFPPDDPQRGHTYAERVKAILRRHVVERCIYGVDINPLAVEFARVSLWVETLDPELPFTFLDHKIKVGNALVGSWLDRVQDYPLKAWEREGGDGKDGERTARLETMLKGEKSPSTGRRPGMGPIKLQMKHLIETRFQRKFGLFDDPKKTEVEVLSSIRHDYEKLHEFPATHPDERERYYRQQVLANPALKQLKQAMDEWCAVWFWPADGAALKEAPTPESFHAHNPQRGEVVKRLAAEQKFFHWELEFPDVFTPERAGFDAVVGNPPWEVMKPNSQEFFTEFDPLYRTYDNQRAVRRQDEMFKADDSIKQRWLGYDSVFKSMTNWVGGVSDPYAVSMARGGLGEALAADWKSARSERLTYADAQHPFRHQGGADLNSYKMFLEAAYRLLTPKGRLGFIVPAGLYTDKGSRELRELFLDHSSWEWLFCFENRKRIFDIHGLFKFAVVIVDRGTIKEPFKVAFMIHDLEAWETKNPPVVPFDRALIPLFSPFSKSLPEVRTERDLTICRTIYSGLGERCGVPDGYWRISTRREFHMTNDSAKFPSKEKWIKQGYAVDRFGRWQKDQVLGLPFLEGRIIDNFDCIAQGHMPEMGHTARWRDIFFNEKQFHPQYVMLRDTYLGSGKRSAPPKLGHRKVTSATNSRTSIVAFLPDFPCGESIYTIRTDPPNISRLLGLSSILNSLTFDFALRVRFGGLNLTWFIFSELQVPINLPDQVLNRLVIASASLSLCHPLFCAEWLHLKSTHPLLASKPWKAWWAVTAADRLRLRVELDAICASLYQISPDDFDWIVRNDPSDPKGFWRIDEELPYRERLTGLARKAFRALKDGKWSAETVETLSNDEFFELLDIPELTNEKAAKLKGLPGPLIHKRNGCHRWEPEKFTPDDPRYGWTWEDCHKDAVALLGSEQAVADYIAGKHETPSQVAPNKAKKGKKAAGDSALPLFGDQ